ncbi:MAG: phosphopantothenoylcysteine decarboxylase [Verrucomicrobiales bacterium]|nr:phosphopantothenoylcysteine decarboxylase [Verrucomicrobiales bacterium]
MADNNKNSGKTILLGVTGSIAAYKAADLASQLVKLGHQVNVIMTREAQEFITPLTLQTLSRQAVITRLADENNGWQPGHIQLADSADLLLIAPATANIIAKLAHGIADDALSSIALATRAPLLIAPAMNGNMWQHSATVDNVKTLQNRDAYFIGPEKDGMLACGYEGAGRLWPVEGIINKVEEFLTADGADSRR